MSKLVEFRNAERELRQQLEALESLKSDGALQKELEFEDRLKSLMSEYGVDLVGLISILDPHSISKPGFKGYEGGARTRQARKVKRYKNPHSGEVVETKGGNHRVLKEWKLKWGGDEVESWATIL